MLFWQDVVFTVSPYPYALGEPSDAPLDECWVVRPQLFFSQACHLRLMGGRQPKRANYAYGADDIQVQLVFYSTCEPVVLPGGNPMDAAGVQKLYKPSPTPILHVGPAANVLGCVLLMPLFLRGNSTPTVPHQLRQHMHGTFPYGLADAAVAQSKNGMNIYEVNTWLWEFRRGKHRLRLGGLSVAATEERRIAVMKGGTKKAVATRVRRRCKAPKAAGARGGTE